MKLPRIFRRNADLQVYDQSPASVPGHRFGRAGFSNPLSGGGLRGADKNEGYLFSPVRITTRHDLEVVYVQSWAARKLIDIPVEDMVTRWRRWNDDPSMNELMAEQERVHMVREKMARTMKAARLYGTAFLLISSVEAPLEEPLMFDSVREGDLRALQNLDRFEMSVEMRDADLFSPSYGQPLFYQLQSHTGGRSIRVHASRLLRFDGIQPLRIQGFERYDEWGISVLVPAIALVIHEHSAAAGASHLVQEASMPVIKMENLRAILAGQGEREDSTPQQVGEMLNQYKSIYRTMFLDSEDEFDRVNVSFGGVPDLMDRFARRLAACADIPATRFWGQSPLGLNATGESDLKNYAVFVAAQQVSQLTDPLRKLDSVLMRNAGLVQDDPPEYEWLSLMDVSDEEQAMVAKTKAEALNLAVTSMGAMDEDEARESLSGDPVFGELEGGAPGMPEPEPPAGGGGPPAS